MSNAHGEEATYKWTDMGWGENYGPWRYQLFSGEELDERLGIYADSKIDPIARVSSVSFQPCLNEDYRSQDRRVVQTWNLKDGRWRFVGVFDGHAGHETADHAVVEIPLRLKAKLESLLSDTTADDSLASDTVSSLLSAVITAYDDSLLDDLSAIFPGGLEGALELSESQLDAIINDADQGGENLKVVHRCMRGSTALIALVDPSGKNLWVANLGDCEAVLGTKSPDGEWKATPLTSNHNGGNEVEVKRVRNDHPGENECVLNGRVLGAIAVTRALGDYLFKLPPAYTTKIFCQAKPGFLFRIRAKVEGWLQRNITPPYLSRYPDVVHRQFSSGDEGIDTFLIMCSDGLADLGSVEGANEPSRWVEVVGGTLGRGGESLALALLRASLGGNDVEKVSQYMTLENTETWMDDTTIAVLML